MWRRRSAVVSAKRSIRCGVSVILLATFRLHKKKALDFVAVNPLIVQCISNKIVTVEHSKTFIRYVGLHVLPCLQSSHGT